MNFNSTCTGCLYMERIPWARERTAYRCMSMDQGHYGRIVDTQLPQAIPALYRPAWCKDIKMKEKAKKLAEELRGMNLPYGNVRECGRQLFDIVKNDEALCGIVLEDLKNQNMSVKDCEKKIAEFARARHGIDSHDAEVVIRKFYGLPDAAPREDDFLCAEDADQEAKTEQEPEKTEREPGKTERETEQQKTENFTFDLSAFL